MKEWWKVKKRFRTSNMAKVSLNKESTISSRNLRKVKIPRMNISCRLRRQSVDSSKPRLFSMMRLESICKSKTPLGQWEKALKTFRIGRTRLEIWRGLLRWSQRGIPLRLIHKPRQHTGLSKLLRLRLRLPRSMLDQWAFQSLQGTKHPSRTRFSQKVATSNSPIKTIRRTFRSQR